jgi:hypothetical protein
MKAFGYTRSDAESESLLEFREVSLCLSPDEIELIIAFLRNAKTRFDNCSPTAGQSHLHLRDFWKEWRDSEPDVIIVYDGESKQSADSP